MEISCPRCGGVAEPAGHEDARAFFRCPTCRRVWATHITAADGAAGQARRRAPRVLVAEDSPEMLSLLAAWLEDEGCVVLTAGSGREALEAAGTYHPDVAIVDVVLPPPDGFQVCESLIEQRGMPVVLMTGMPDPDARRVRQAGAILLLQKPFTREVLIDALALALKGRHPAGPAPSDGLLRGAPP